MVRNYALRSRRSHLIPLVTESPTVSLHGGPVGLDRHTFRSIPRTASTLFSQPELETIEKSISNAELFSFSSPAGDQGFPGGLEVEVLMSAVPPVPLQLDGPFTENIERIRAIKDIVLGSVLIVYRARVKEAADGSKVATPVNLTQVRQSLHLSGLSTLLTTPLFGSALGLQPRCIGGSIKRGCA